MNADVDDELIWGSGVFSPLLLGSLCNPLGPKVLPMSLV